MTASRNRSSEKKQQASLHALAAPLADAIKLHYASNKLILTHPSNRYRNLLISALIATPPCELFYHALSFDDMNLAQFLTGLSHSLADQIMTYDSQANLAVNRGVTPTGLADARTLAEVFAHDLEQLSGEHYLLILDEYDRADTVIEIQDFVEQLLDVLPAHCHLLVSSRTQPRLPWLALVARNQAVVLRETGSPPGRLYSEHFSENPTLEAYALGPGHVFLNGQPLTSWEGQIPKLLFFFTLDQQLPTRADICQALWHEWPVEQAVNSFHVTKQRLNKVFGFDVLVRDGTHYRIKSDLNLHYDVQEFVTSLAEARRQSGDEAERCWQHAVELYRGPYLNGCDDEWITGRRADYQQGYIEALEELARIRESQNRANAALNLLLRAVSVAYEREDLHREVIRLYGKLGRNSEAAAYYVQLASELKKRYRTSPSPQTTRVYQEVIGQP